MNLREFIRSSLVDIAAGVHEAAADASELVAIAPGAVDGVRREIIEKVDFDIAVTVSAEAVIERNGTAKIGGKLKIVVVDAKLGAGGNLDRKTTDKHDEVSRIKFSVPVHFNAHFRRDPDRAANNAEMREVLKRLP